MTLQSTLSRPTFHMPLQQTPRAPLSPVVLYPVLKAEALLLGHPKRRRFLDKIIRFTGLDLPLYQTLYETCISRCAELMQALPYQTGGAPGGLLDYSLERAVIALRNYHESAGTDFSPLYAYALFTAALFQELGKIMSQQLVMISDEDGKFVSEWHPLQGSLVTLKAAYYKWRTSDDRWITLGQSVTPFLAKQCMPEPGFEWITEDRRIFSYWMGVLLGDKDQAGEFFHRMELALKMVGLLDKEERLMALEIEGTRPVQTAVGEDFLEWLKNGLQDGTILVNTADANVHVLPNESLLIEAQLFQQFTKIYGRSAGWMVACKQFNSLGLGKKSGEDVEFDRFFSKTQENIAAENAVRNPKLGGFFNNPSAPGSTPVVREGLVVVNPAILYGNVAVPAAATHLVAASPPPPPASSLSSIKIRVQEWAMQHPTQVSHGSGR